jgi:23S rRNA G2445 N2-methylase RlmL
MTPNLNMKFDFEHWPVHDPAEFAQAKRQILRQYDNYEGALVGEFAEVRYFGNDISGKAIESARHNFEGIYRKWTILPPQLKFIFCFACSALRGSNDNV